MRRFFTGFTDWFAEIDPYQAGQASACAAVFLSIVGAAVGLCIWADHAGRS